MFDKLKKAFGGSSEPAPKVEKKVPNILTSKEVELLLEQPKNIDLKGIRDKSMLEFAYATGMRVTEIISLDITDINLKENFCDYTDEELEYIKECFLNEQEKHPYGVCIHPKIHHLFHKLYGQKTTDSQWNDFCEKCTKM